MDDREIVAAIVAGDLTGLAAAYDEHAESLYGYTRWMLGEPDEAADAVENTFAVAAGRLDRLGEPRKLRPWLFAVARNECQLRLRASEVGLGEDTGLPDPPSDTGLSARGRAERAELARLVRTALDELSPAEREVLELDLRHDLQGADLAAVLGVPRNQAQALASRARGALEAALGALFAARTGRRGCAELDLLLDGWDGQLTGSTRRLVSRHIEQCDACADHSHGALRAAVRYGMAPLAALPPELRDEVLQLCADSGPETLSYRRDVTQGAGPFLPSGFPQAIRAPRRRMFALSGAAAAVGVLVAIMATGIVAVLALTGSHSPRSAAAGTSGSSGSASATATGDAGTPSGAPSGESPAISTPSSSSAPPPAAAASVSPTRVKRSPSHPAVSPSPATPTPRFTFHPPTPTPTATSTATSTATGTATPPSTSTPAA
jgi:RNA polymerase sigma factor (sigma-70 family)